MFTHPMGQALITMLALAALLIGLLSLWVDAIQ